MKTGKVNRYIATFHSHYGATAYFRALTEQGISAKLMPVPRKVSSSCGTCVYYEHVSAINLDFELDCVYLEENSELTCVLTTH